MGNGKRESNGCTVHFNSILQLLYINHKVSIKLWLNLKSAKKHLSFFFYSFVFHIFSFTFEHYKGFFSFFFSFKLLLDHTSTSCTIEVSSIFLHLVALKWKERTNNQTMKEKEPKTGTSTWIKWTNGTTKTHLLQVKCTRSVRAHTCTLSFHRWLKKNQNNQKNQKKPKLDDTPERCYCY